MNKLKQPQSSGQNLDAEVPVEKSCCCFARKLKIVKKNRKNMETEMLLDSDGSDSPDEHL